MITFFIIQSSGAQSDLGATSGFIQPARSKKKMPNIHNLLTILVAVSTDFKRCSADGNKAPSLTKY